MQWGPQAGANRGKLPKVKDRWYLLSHSKTDSPIYADSMHNFSSMNTNECSKHFLDSLDCEHWEAVWGRDDGGLAITKRFWEGEPIWSTWKLEKNRWTVIFLDLPMADKFPCGKGRYSHFKPGPPVPTSADEETVNSWVPGNLWEYGDSLFTRSI